MKCFYIICRMLRTRSVFTVLFSFSFSLLFAQINPSYPDKFGIDGDVTAQESLSKNAEPFITHDWFNKLAGNNFGVFDTVGSAVNRELIAMGKNHAFTKKMQHKPYTVEDGILMLGGTYDRDFFGISTTGDQSDKTVFVPSVLNNKSYTDPSGWTTIPTGSAIPSKTDIIDTYIHLRRNGSSITNNMMVYFAATTLSTGGEHHLDFELYKSEIAYNPGTGFFTTAGPLSTGGRNIWEFNADGSVKSFGEMTLSFSFNSTAVSDIAIYIWVPYTTYATINPKEFYFVAGEWNGANKFGGYGYARIKPNEGAVLPAWGTVNSGTTAGPAWGTNAREISTTSISFYSDVYSQGQFAEAAIDLTSLGIDPAFASGNSKCRSPYVKVMVKSRSSSPFSSALQDFIAPYDLFEEPVIAAAIAQPGVLSCSQGSQVLAPQQVVSGAVYKWSTTNGNIVSGHNTAQALINKSGLYSLSASVYEGCTETTDQVVVSADTSQPVATADYSGFLSGDENNTIILRGGDAEKSNFSTPFGPSQGLLWQWHGPDGYAASEQNPKASAEGTYYLTVTEIRNGCTAIDSVTVSKTEQAVLPLVLINFNGNTVDNKVQLSWQVEGNEKVERFEIERAAEGRNSTAGIIWAIEESGKASYNFSESVSASRGAYRLKIQDKENGIRYSKWVQFSKSPQVMDKELRVINPVVNNLVISFAIGNKEKVAINVYDATGRLAYSQQEQCVKGENVFIIDSKVLATKGYYTLELITDNRERKTTQVIKL